MEINDINHVFGYVYNNHSSILKYELIDLLCVIKTSFVNS